MRWYHYVAYFFGGMFLANAVPHFVNGVSGHPFQSPFASPPGEGLSSSTTNVLWGFFNLVVGYVLVARVGKFDLRSTRHVVVLGLGVLAMGLMLARTFGRFYGGLASHIVTDYFWFLEVRGSTDGTEGLDSSGEVAAFEHVVRRTGA